MTIQLRPDSPGDRRQTSTPLSPHQGPNDGGYARGYAGGDWAEPACPGGREHGRDSGSLDESSRRLSHSELAVAHLLSSEGHEVVANRERGRVGPVADLSVCGAQLEVKELIPLSERPHGPASARTVYNSLTSASNQADRMVLWDSGSGLRKADAVAGVHTFLSRYGTSALCSIRVESEAFELRWEAGRSKEIRVRDRLDKSVDTDQVRTLGEGRRLAPPVAQPGARSWSM